MNASARLTRTRSHALRVRGLKQRILKFNNNERQSHALRVRGLKRAFFDALHGKNRRTLYACVD